MDSESRREKYECEDKVKTTYKTMNRFSKIAMALCTALCAWTIQPAAAQGTTTEGGKWHFERGSIVVESPARPEGQQHALGLTVPKMKAVRVAFVGLGMRGIGAVERWTLIPGVQIVALCDFRPEIVKERQKILAKAGLPAAAEYSGEDGYKELCKRNDIDLVYIATDWLHHYLVARCALENNKNVAIEVPSAMNLKECWDLVNLSEKTRKHCMLLENCCYDWFELDALNMAQQGVFGEVLRAQGAYIHNLDDFWNAYWKKDANDKLGWRLEFNMKHRGDVYATHGLGPVAQVMNIHRGDRFRTLVAMDTKSSHGQELVKQRLGSCEEFRNGDHTTTLLSTQNGKVIEIQHDVMNPQPYNRLYQLTGTKGFANKYPSEGFALSSNQLKASGAAPKIDNLTAHDFMPASEAKALREKFRSPIAKRYAEKSLKVGGHGGMDFTMDSRLVYCLQNGLPLDIDVYDLAEWCCLAELGELSMDNNNTSVQVPDFTRGHWNDVKGYSYAWASPEDEAKAEADAEAFTAGMKRGGTVFLQKYWAATAKGEKALEKFMASEAKAAAKAAKSKKK